MIYDVIVIGGGPSGMLAAVGARNHGADVLLVERNKELGKKMLISGGGRCNLSNTASIDKLIENVPGNGKFLYSAFHNYSNNDLIRFFEEVIGIKTKVEDRGRVFPVSDRSKTIIDGLENYLKKIGVKIIYESILKEVISQGNKVVSITLEDGTSYETKSVILATGGLSFPKTGSTGDGHRIARELGHSITELFPASVPLTSNDELITNKVLQGLSLRNIKLSLYSAKGKLLKQEIGDVIFTHFGISGPAVLRISRYVALQKNKHNSQECKLSLDLFPDRNEEELQQEIQALINRFPKKLIANGLDHFIPEKIILAFVNKNEDIRRKRMNELGKKDILTFLKFVKQFTLNINGTRSIKEAVVTGGGVNVKEIDPKTFSSKMIEGLYLVGELLNIDAYTGGYNMQVAFSSGYTAGKSASMYATAMEKD